MVPLRLLPVIFPALPSPIRPAARLCRLRRSCRTQVSRPFLRPRADPRAVFRASAMAGEVGDGASSRSVENGELQLGSGGFEATMNRLSKWLVAALFGLVILWKHDAEALWAAMGSVLNSWLSVVLKRLLNHQRPTALRSDPGMPSSHAQSIFYAIVFAVLSLFQWQGINFITLLIGAAILSFGTYLSWLRVTQQLHTVDQVLVGAIIGSACSALWFWLWHHFVLKAFISSIIVRIVVVLGSVAFCIGFLAYVLRHWLADEL